MLTGVKKQLNYSVRNIFDSVTYYSCALLTPYPAHVKNICFVCKGNICRSAFAELLLKKHLKQQGIAVTSCGLNAGTGCLAPPYAIKAAKYFGVNMENHRSNTLKSSDVANSDLILAMELWQYKTLVRDYPSKRMGIRLLREFSGFPLSVFCNISDPFGQSLGSFLNCFSLIGFCIKGVNTHIFDNPSPQNNDQNLP